jgi:hypothetical protein
LQAHCSDICETTREDEVKPFQRFRCDVHCEPVGRDAMSEVNAYRCDLA